MVSDIRAAPLNLSQKCRCVILKIRQIWKQFNEQRTNCGVDYFDYCLLHNMGTNVYEKCRKYGAFDFMLPNLKTATLTRKENKNILIFKAQL